MVGLVVVCHSRALARAAVALAAEMLHGRPVPVEIAAGLDETTFGTDAVAIVEAVTAADQGDGVVVLMDLGSAVLSAELALELLTDGLRERVVLSPGPLVEGLVAAAVAAAAGADRHEVAGEAAAGLAGKQSQLGIAAPGPIWMRHRPPEGTPERHGHRSGRDHDRAQPARPARPPGRAPCRRGAGVRRGRGDPQPQHRVAVGAGVQPVQGRDPRRAARTRNRGTRVRPQGTGRRRARRGARRPRVRRAERDDRPDPAGPDGYAPPPTPSASTATTAVAASEADPGPPATAPSLAGQPASPGIAIGPAWQWRPATPDIPNVPSQGPAAEWARISGALGTVRRDLHRIRAATARDAGENQAAIFDAHLLLLDDTDLLADVRVPDRSRIRRAAGLVGRHGPDRR